MPADGEPAPAKVYVSNLAYAVDDAALSEAFRDRLGDDAVITTEVIKNREGLPKGFGFVVLSDADAMQSAIDKMDHVPLMGREIGVTRAIPKDQMPPRAAPYAGPSPFARGGRDYGGYGGYGGGYGGRYITPAAPMPGGRGSARGGFRVFVTGLPPHFSWRELKDFLRTGSQDVTYTNVKRPGTGIGEWATAPERDMAIRNLHGTTLEGSVIRIREDADEEVEPLVPPVAPMGRMSAYDDPLYAGYAAGYGGVVPPRSMYADPYYDDMRGMPMRGSAYDMPLASRALAMDMPMRGARDYAAPVAPRGYGAYGRMDMEPPMASYYGASRYADRSYPSRARADSPPARYGSGYRLSSAAVPAGRSSSRYAPY